MSSLGWACAGDECQSPTWDHIFAQVVVAAVPWAVLTSVGLAAAFLAPERARESRLALRIYETGLASSSFASSWAIMGVCLLQCLIFAKRAAERQVDIIYHSLEMIIVPICILDVLAGWSFVVTQDWRAVLRYALGGRLFMESLLITSVVSFLYRPEGQGKTWFSFLFLASFRMMRVVEYVQMTELNTAKASWKRQAFYFVARFALFLFGVAATMFGLELLAEPVGTMGTEEARGKAPTDPLGALLFAVATVTTLGNRSGPQTIFGRLFTILLIAYASYKFVVEVGPMIIATLLGHRQGMGDYRRPNQRSGHVIVVGTPSGRMLYDFLHEIFHENHFDSVKEYDDYAVDVVVLLPDDRTLKQLHAFLGHKSSMLFRSRVIALKGEPFNIDDLRRVQLHDAMRVFVLPNIITSDTSTDDAANIMRAFAVARAAPHVHATCVLHSAQNSPKTLSRKGSNLSFMSIDAWKLSLMAVGCRTKGTLALILNLCKTIGDSGDLKTKTWQRDYEHSVGSELYVLPLSSAYDGESFEVVMLDVLHRSPLGEVVMIGLVIDAPADSDEERIVRIHPGCDYAIKADGRTSGIFIAPDVARIRQRGEKYANDQSGARKLVSFVKSPRRVDRGSDKPKSMKDTYNEMIETVSQHRASFWALLNDAKSETMKGNVEREKNLLAEAYDRSMFAIKHNLLVQGVNVELVNGVSSSFAPSVDTTKADTADLREAATAIGGFSVLQRPPSPHAPEPVKLSLNSPLYSPEETMLADLEHKSWLWDKMAKDARDHAPLPSNVQNHVLLLVVSDTTSNVDHLKSARDHLGPAIGIEHFMRPMRDRRFRSAELNPTVVVLADAMPFDWHSVVNLERTYFVRGSPLSLEALNRAHFRKAKTVAITKAHLGGHLASDTVSDARVLMLAGLVEQQLQGTNVHVITDLAFEGSCMYLPRGYVPVEMPHAEPSVQPPPHWESVWDLFGFTSDDSKVEDLEFSPPPAEEDYEGLPTLPAAFHPRFMTGQVFLASAVTSFVANTLYNPELMQLVGSLMQAPLLLLPLPANWEKRAYCDLVAWLMRSRNLIALGIYRNSQASDAGAFGKPVDETIPSHHFMYTAPPAYMTLVFRTDQILCLAPT